MGCLIASRRSWHVKRLGFMWGHGYASKTKGTKRLVIILGKIESDKDEKAFQWHSIGSRANSRIVFRASMRTEASGEQKKWSKDFAKEPHEVKCDYQTLVQHRIALVIDKASVERHSPLLVSLYQRPGLNKEARKKIFFVFFFLRSVNNVLGSTTIASEAIDCLFTSWDLV